MSWSRRNLGDLTRIRTGKLDANASSEEGGYPFFTCAKEPLRIASYSYDCECALVAGNGDLNVKYYKGKFDAYQRTYIVEARPDSMNLVDVRYVYHFLETYLETLRDQSIGGIIKYIKLGNLTDAQIPVPSLAEQKRIAGILDAADALRAKRREALAQLDVLLQATFNDLFGDPVTNPKGWKTQTLDKLCFGISDIDHNMPKGVECGVPFISAKDLTDDGSISFDDVKMISQGDYERLGRKGRPQKGDIIYSRIGVKLGKARLVDVSFDFLASYSCCTIKPNNDLVDRRFLCHLLDSPSILRQATSGIRAIAVPDLGLAKIKAFSIILPPRDLQNRFENFVQELDRQKTRFRAHLAGLNTLFASLQHRAFRGEL